MRIKTWHAVALLFCVVWTVYYPALFAPLCSIDDVRMVNELLNRPAVGWVEVWFPRSVTFYRPLVSGSFVLDFYLWNLETPFLHFENVLIHCLNSLLVFFLARLVACHLELDRVLVPLVSALVFALHPINTEAVIWVAGRADLFAGTFTLASLICTLCYLREGRWFWLLSLLLVFLAGCLAKETVLFIVPGVILLSLLVRRDLSGKGGLFWRPTLVCLLGVGGYFLLRGYALRARDLGLQHVARAFGGEAAGPTSGFIASPDHFERLWSTLATVLQGAGFYARKLVQPFPLTFGINAVHEGYLWVGMLLVGVALLLLRRLSWPGCFILAAMGLGSAALLVALGQVSWTPLAERYMYSPSAMLAIGCTVAGAGVLQTTECRAWRRVGCGVLSLILVVFAVGVFQRGVVWQDNLTLFTDTVEKSPDFSLAQNELANILWQRGDYPAALKIVRAIDVPDTQEASLNKVLIYLDEGRLAEARAFLLGKLNSANAQGYHTATLKRLDSLLDIMSRQSDDPEQRRAYDVERIGYLLQLLHHTGEPFYHYRIGILQMKMGDNAAARQSFAAAYRLLPAASPYKQPAGKLAGNLKAP